MKDFAKSFAQLSWAGTAAAHARACAALIRISGHPESGAREKLLTFYREQKKRCELAYPQLADTAPNTVAI